VIEIRHRCAGYVLRFVDADSLADADLAYAKLDGADLADADLAGATLTYAILNRADLTRSNLRGAKLTRAILTSAYLTRSNLRGANLRGANLTGAFLVGANLRDANLTGAILDGANLRGANLYRADLSFARLDDANLTDATMDGAIMDGATLTRAIMDGMTMDGDGVLPTSTKENRWGVIERWADLAGCSVRRTRKGRVRIDLPKSKMCDDFSVKGAYHFLCGWLWGAGIDHLRILDAYHDWEHTDPKPTETEE